MSRTMPVPVDAIHYKTSGQHGVGIYPNILILTALQDAVNYTLREIRQQINPLPKEVADIMKKLK